MNGINEENNAKSEIVKYDTKDIEKQLAKTKRKWEKLSHELQTVKNAIELHELIEKGKEGLKKSQKIWIKAFAFIGIALPIAEVIASHLFFYYSILLVDNPTKFIVEWDAFFVVFTEVWFFGIFKFYPKKAKKSESQKSLEELLSEELQNTDTELLKEKQLELETQIESVRTKVEKYKEIIKECKMYNWLKILEYFLGNTQNIEAMMRPVRQKLNQLESMGEIITKEQDLRKIALYGLAKEWETLINGPISTENIPNLDHLKYKPSIEPVTFTNQPKSLALILSEIQNQDAK